MKKTNFFSGKDKELYEMALSFEKAMQCKETFYLDADDWADLADWYADRRKGEWAHKAAENGLHQHPGHTGLLVQQAYLYLYEQRLEKAKSVLESIEENYLPEVIILKANLLMEYGEDARAEELLETIEAPMEIHDIIEVIYFYIEYKMACKAQPWMKRLKECHDEHAYKAVSADYLFATGQYDEAIKMYNELLDKEPYSAPCWYGLSRCYMELNEPNKAIEAADFSTVADEEFGDAYFVKATAYTQLGNNSKAQMNYRLAAKYGAITEDVYLYFEALVSIEAQNWQAAYESLKKILEQEGEISTPVESVYSHMTICLYNMKEYTKALDYCALAEELNPDDVQNYFTEAGIYMELNQDELCMNALIKATELEPTAESWISVGELCSKYGNTIMALKAFERAEMINPSTPGLTEHLTMMYLMLQNKEKFLEYNAKCERPFTMEQIKLIQDWYETNGTEEDINRINDILSSLQ